MSVAPLARADESSSIGVSIARSQPDYLATLVQLRGMQPVPPAGARVLDLNCGAGQNLIPLAERYPAATFLGVDASPRRVAVARAMARDLGLSNVEFRQADVATFVPVGGPYDYIIVDDVYSHLASVAGDNLLRVCRDYLSPQGLVYLSARSLPGYGAQSIMRRLLQSESRAGHAREVQLQTNRRLLGFIGGALVGEQPYAQLMRSVAATLQALPDAQLTSQQSGEIDEACYLTTFAARAARHGLQFIANCGLGISGADNLGTESERQLADITDDRLARQQFRDIVRNRAMHLGVFCRAGAVPLDAPEARRMRGMYLSAPLRAESDEGPYLRDTRLDRFITPSGLRVSTAAPIIKAAFVHLGRIWPARIQLEELIATSLGQLLTGQPATDLSAEQIERFEDSIYEAAASGVIELSLEEQSFAAVVSEKPTASPVARWQALRGEVCTNRKHEPLRLGYFERHVLGLLDGTRDRPQLLADLNALAASGTLLVLQSGEGVQDEQRAQHLIAAVLPETLAGLAHSAFLVA